jgi:hypothetical protein
MAATVEAMAWAAVPWALLPVVLVAAEAERPLLWKGYFPLAAEDAAPADPGEDGGDALAYAIVLTDLERVWTERATRADVVARQAVRPHAVVVVVVVPLPPLTYVRVDA